MDKCELCGKREDERNTQEQAGFILCNSCDGLYSDEELKEVI
jgi:ribosome-binding protein aMBF1 (putative translation factor)